MSMGLKDFELAHEKGSHLDKSYQTALTDIAEKLIFIALKEPKFFD